VGDHVAAREVHIVEVDRDRDGREGLGDLLIDGRASVIF
jgi:hypothetical protein